MGIACQYSRKLVQISSEFSTINFEYADEVAFFDHCEKFCQKRELV